MSYKPQASTLLSHSDESGEAVNVAGKINDQWDSMATEIGTLKEVVKSHEATIENLDKNLDELHEDFDKMVDELVDVKLENDLLSADLEDSTNEYNELIDEYNELVDQINDLENRGVVVNANGMNTTVHIDGNLNVVQTGEVVEKDDSRNGSITPLPKKLFGQNHLSVNYEVETDTYHFCFGNFSPSKLLQYCEEAVAALKAAGVISAA